MRLNNPQERNDHSLSKEDVIEVEGIIQEALPNAMFNVKLSNGHVILFFNLRL